MALESKLQKKVRLYLKRKGWLVVKLSLTSLSGWPDLECIKDGRTVRIEMKAPGKKLEELQKYRHAQIKEHGGEVYTVDSFELLLDLGL